MMISSGVRNSCETSDTKSVLSWLSSRSRWSAFSCSSSVWRRCVISTPNVSKCGVRLISTTSPDNCTVIIAPSRRLIWQSRLRTDPERLSSSKNFVRTERSAHRPSSRVLRPIASARVTPVVCRNASLTSTKRPSSSLAMVMSTGLDRNAVLNCAAVSRSSRSRSRSLASASLRSVMSSAAVSMCGMPSMCVNSPDASSVRCRPSLARTISSMPRTDPCSDICRKNSPR